ncbi:MAG: serine hydrolase domain-containing protein, partial [Kiritimatiellia bacterium]
MKSVCAFLCAAVVACVASAAEMERSTPEAEGVSSAAIGAWIDACERELDAVHGFVIVRHGKTIAEGWWRPFGAERTHMLYSHSKSFTSTAIGFLADDGKLDLDERVVDIFPERAPAPSASKIDRLRVRDLLTMTTGMPYTDAERKDFGGDWVKLFLANEVKDEPGTVYRYDSCATHVLAAIVERKSGMKLMDFLKARLFDEIGITRAWTTYSPTGVACGGWGMNMTTRELARFGQFYLQEGRWGGRQLLSRNWVRLATGYQTSTQRPGDGDWSQGYGFQFWRCRHNCFRADGAFGQYTVVMPDQDAVVSLHAGLGPMNKELDLVWKHLLPAMQAGALPENPAAQKALADRCARLALKTVAGAASAG